MDSKGFTLIELVVVIVIMGILAAVAIPKYVDMAGQAKKAHDSSQLNSLRSATHLLYAKSVLETGSTNWPAEADINAQMSKTNFTWKFYTNVIYTQSSGQWSAEPNE